ncbi:hypothetical protein LF41_804 [Lysobacter dokdonensis DS-58]|uniref:Uncharacterized protein n=1 Tax=Lysobacter dokdonensis DS-58 TaxID=1300345 RepID=A0A0A2WKD2_9GAMM|nr:hypothetical protein [Lysobacter dokdonensis]KGQ20268.1 hypothetical protein LF41_804 [Lysobacter dokdonensis DS-58]
MADDTDGDFAELSRWLPHDAARVRRIVAAFHRITVRDLLSMEHAAARGDWGEVRRLAERISMGCKHVGETRAAACLAPLLETQYEVSLKALYFAWYAPRRGGLLRLVDRAASVAMGEAFA